MAQGWQSLVPRKSLRSPGNSKEVRAAVARVNRGQSVGRDLCHYLCILGSSVPTHLQTLLCNE